MEDRHQVSKISAILFARTGRRIPKPRAVQLFGEPFKWVDEARYLGVTLDKRLNWSKHIDQVRKKAAQRLGTLGSLLKGRSGLSIRKGVLPAPFGGPPLAPISRNCKYCSSSFFALLPVHPSTLVTGKFTTNLESPFLR
jgi:hypothetical protein